MPWLLGAGLLLKVTAAAAPASPVTLWPAGAPGALGTAAHDAPTLTPYPATRDATPTPAIVVCPGGGYGGLAGHEGQDYALFLNRLGVSAFVLKYRLGTHGYRHPAMLQDAARAVRWVRARAADYAVDPGRVGIMGSSAGGHLASTLMTHFDAGQPGAADPVDRFSSRPDLGILCYPVISMGPIGHQGSRQNLLGPDASAALVELLSNELQVTPETPPAFLWHTADDPVVPVENSMEFAAALRRHRVPFELHVYESGRHGLGLGAAPPDFAQPHPWTHDLVHWLRGRGFVAAIEP